VGRLVLMTIVYSLAAPIYGEGGSRKAARPPWGFLYRLTCACRDHACHRCGHRMAATRLLAKLAKPNGVVIRCRHPTKTRVNHGALWGHANTINGGDAERYLCIT
jgi:hypothetical protein